MLTFTLKRATNLPVELAGITPDSLAGKSRKAIERIDIWQGNQSLPLGELFDLAGDGSDGQLLFVGDLHSAVGIGAAMECGLIRVDGNAGHNVGLGMTAGAIEVAGDAGDNVGAEMLGGLIRVRGAAGANVGAALVGSLRGMTGGTILIGGAAGDFVGSRMRRGLIAVGGAVGDFAGHSMLAGSIVIAGQCGVYPGAQMSRGTIWLANTDRVRLLPTFAYACTIDAPILAILGKYIQSIGLENPLENANRVWQQFNGDLLTSGRGEVFVAQAS